MQSEACFGKIADSQFHSPFDTGAADLRASLSFIGSPMSEIDDIFARLGGGRITATDHRDLRDIPRRGKTGGSRVVEVVHLPTGRSGQGAAGVLPPRRRVRARTYLIGFCLLPCPEGPRHLPRGPTGG